MQTTRVAIMKRPDMTKLYERRREVANLALQGWTQAAIARHMRITQGTVSRDLAALREFWREFPVHEVDKVRLETSAEDRPPRGPGLGRLAALAAAPEFGLAHARQIRRAEPHQPQASDGRSAVS